MTISSAMGKGKNIPIAATRSALKKFTSMSDIASSGMNVTATAPKRPAKTISGKVVLIMYQRFLK